MMSYNNNSNNNNKQPQTNEFGRAMASLLQIGITIIACVATGVFLGWFLDRWLGTTPWIMFVTTFFGIGAAFKSIFDFAKKV